MTCTPNHVRVILDITLLFAALCSTTNPTNPATELNVITLMFTPLIRTEPLFERTARFVFRPRPNKPANPS